MPGQGTVVGLPKTVRTARLRPELQFERISTKPLIDISHVDITLVKLIAYPGS